MKNFKHKTSCAVMLKNPRIQGNSVAKKSGPMFKDITAAVGDKYNSR
jgi:hypothetical protein